MTIDDPQSDGTVGSIPFALWPAQRELLDTFATALRVIVLKARQLGISWLACGNVLYDSLYKCGRESLLFSRGQLEADELKRRIEVMYRRLPQGERDRLPMLVKSNASELVWDNGSRVQSLPATENSGRSFTASKVVMDEFAFMAWADRLYTAVKPTVDGGGQLIIISTANGQNNLFAKLWDGAQKGSNGFAPVFLPWQSRPGRDDAWRTRIEAEAAFSWQAAQEYPANPEEAFQNTGNERFLPSMLMWDACREELPPLTRRDAMVLCADAGVSNDSFALVGVTRHPTRHDDVAVRFVQEWKPPRGGQINFGEPEAVIRQLCARGSGFNVAHCAYDPYMLHDMMMRLQHDGVVMTQEFNQGASRLEADKQLLDLIMQKRIAHDGNATLREHIDHCDRKPDPESRKLRIVKREQSLKVDCAVALSMGAYRCLELPL